PLRREDGGDDVDPAVLGIGHELERQWLLRAVSGFGEQRLGLGLIVRTHARDVDGVQSARRDDPYPRRGLALESDLHDLLAVDPVAADGLAHANVTEDRVR